MNPASKPKQPVTPIKKGSGERPLTARPSFPRPEYPPAGPSSGPTTAKLAS